MRSAFETIVLLCPQHAFDWYHLITKNIKKNALTLDFAYVNASALVRTSWVLFYVALRVWSGWCELVPWRLRPDFRDFLTAQSVRITSHRNVFGRHVQLIVSRWHKGQMPCPQQRWQGIACTGQWCNIEHGWQCLWSVTKVECALWCFPHTLFEPTHPLLDLCDREWLLTHIPRMCKQVWVSATWKFGRTNGSKLYQNKTLVWALKLQRLISWELARRVWLPELMKILAE